MQFDSSFQWLTEKALPLWMSQGIDKKNGGFVEALSREGRPLSLPRRALVQARQMHCCRLALENQWYDSAELKSALRSGADYLIQNFSAETGAFAHSIEANGPIVNPAPELYTQAFAMFGLAQAFAVSAEDTLKARALKVVQYLQQQRALPDGGYSELASTGGIFESNPHMHLFEAAIAWMEVDSDAVWSELASELFQLCQEKFIDPSTGYLAEHFAEGWQPQMHEQAFVAEPGHHYEWAWLMGRYQKLRPAIDVSGLQRRLFSLSEKTGIRQQAVVDEVWSDGRFKKITSRFWPQCERIKCASQLAENSMGDAHLHPAYVAAATEGMNVLMSFFNLPVPGLWCDRKDENGQFDEGPAKASSFYHIIGAINEFQKLKK